MDIKQEIIDSIQVMVDAAIKKVCPTITFGIITSVGNKNKCTIKINNIDYKIVYYGKTAPDLNQKYPVFVPFGKMNLAFIITSGNGEEAESVQWSGVKNTPTTLEGYGITDAPYIIKFTLNQTSVIASKTPSEMSALFTDNGYILAKLYNSTDGIYETLEKITCNLDTITFSTIYQNTLGGGFTYKKVIGNIVNNTWTYEIS